MAVTATRLRVGNTRPRPPKRGQQPWRKDPVILERLDIGATVWAECHAEPECLRRINAHIQARWPEQPAIRRATLHLDRKRIRELWAEHQGDAREEHLAGLRRTVSAAWSAFEQASSSSLNRSAYLSVIANTIEKMARIDGSLVDRKQVKVEGDGAGVTINVMDEAALAEVVRLSLEHLPQLSGLSGPKPDVIDVEARRIGQVGLEPDVVGIVDQTNRDSDVVNAVSVRNEDGMVWTGESVPSDT